MVRKRIACTQASRTLRANGVGLALAGGGGVVGLLASAIMLASLDGVGLLLKAVGLVLLLLILGNGLVLGGHNV